MLIYAVCGVGLGAFSGCGVYLVLVLGSSGRGKGTRIPEGRRGELYDGKAGARGAGESIE